MRARSTVYFVIAWVLSGQHRGVSMEKIMNSCPSHAHVASHGTLRFDRVVAKNIPLFCEKKIHDGHYTATFQLLRVRDTTLSVSYTIPDRVH